MIKFNAFLQILCCNFAPAFSCSFLYKTLKQQKCYFSVMGRKLFVCWLFLLLASIRLFAAGTDSVQTAKKRGPHFVFNFDTRYTLLQNDPARISGLKGGLEWC